MRIKTLAFVALLASAGAASAQTPPDAQPGGPPGGGHGRGAMQACAADRQTYCANAERGPAMRQCLQDNFSKFSPGCQDAIKAMRARRESQGGGPPAPPAPPAPPSPPAPN